MSSEGLRRWRIPAGVLLPFSLRSQARKQSAHSLLPAGSWAAHIKPILLAPREAFRRDTKPLEPPENKPHLKRQADFPACSPQILGWAGGGAAPSLPVNTTRLTGVLLGSSGAALEVLLGLY